MRTARTAASQHCTIWHRARNFANAVWILSPTRWRSFIASRGHGSSYFTTTISWRRRWRTTRCESRDSTRRSRAAAWKISSHRLGLSTQIQRLRAFCERAEFLAGWVLSRGSGNSAPARLSNTIEVSILTTTGWLVKRSNARFRRCSMSFTAT
jgi:hypothetical protein